LEKTEGAIKNEQSRETGNIGETRHMAETIGKCRGQKDKHWSTKHYTENERFSNTNHTKNHG
jgi:hypothetical protein